MSGAPRTCIVAIARATSASVVRRMVVNRCGSTVWSMMPTDQPSASTQMVRVCLPSTFMAPDIAAMHRKASRGPRFPPSPRRPKEVIERHGGERMPIDYEVEYNNRARVPEHPEIFARWVREAAAYRERMKADENAEIGLAYGPTARQTVDLFFPDTTGHTPLAMFIHGGYWRSFEASAFSHMAAGLNARGIAVAVAGYDLVPQVTIAQIIDEIRTACLFLWRRFGQRLMIYGHSAGGHLAACMVATDWKKLDPKAPADLV